MCWGDDQVRSGVCDDLGLEEVCSVMTWDLRKCVVCDLGLEEVCSVMTGLGECGVV